MNTWGVILAGGRSSRMGENKALLNFHGRRLVDHMHSLLSELSGSDVYVRVSGQIEGCVCVPDRVPSCGPLAGIYSVLKMLLIRSPLAGADRQRALFVPVDMPLLRIADLEALLDGVTEQTCLAHYTGQELPIVLPVCSRIYELVGALLQSQGEFGRGPSIREMLAEIALNYPGETIELPPLGSEPFANINTRQEWHRLTASNAYGN